ncbi:RloB domain-containing protein [Chitinophaga caseinilytica]|uniref:RloB domain-containing protein n=1 Tax=Chitinophaga caseinilytica TaxID=2267521 RepID=UPI003C2DF409
MARTSSKRKGGGRKTFAILVDGETEKWYLDKLRAFENPAGISIKPDLPGKKTLADQFEALKRNAEIYDVSIWIVDLDVIILDKQECEFHDYLKEIAKNKALYNKVHILVNAPSLEFWFLQHVKDIGRYFADCNSVIAELKKYHPLKEYSKSEKYFIRGKPDIYERLRPHLSDALTFAKRRGNYDPQCPKRGVAELYRLFELLGVNESKNGGKI